MLQMMTKHYFFLDYISKISFEKFHSIQKNMSVIFAPKLTNFTDFYDKLLKNLYDYNFTLNSVEKNDVKLPLKYGNFTRLEFYATSASWVSALTTSKIFVYRISCKSIYFYYIASLYWIRCFEFLTYEL